MKRREPEKVVFLAYGFRNSAASRTGIARPGSVDIKLIRNAILSSISSFVDEAVVPKLTKKCLHALRVTLFRSADEIIVRNSHPLPQVPELGGNLIRILLRSFSCGFRRPLDLLPVLIRAGKKKCLCAQQSLPPRNGIAGNCRISVPNVRPRIHVVNRRRDVKLPAHKVSIYPVNPVP